MSEPLTKDQAWQQAAERVLALHRKTSRKDTHELQDMLSGLYSGLRIVRDKMTANELRTSDLEQLIACALDALGSGLYEASQRGESPELAQDVH